MKFGSITEFVRFLDTRQGALREAQKVGLGIVGRMFVAEANALIGQEVESWAPLALATIEDKQRRGYVGRVSPTDPLFARGDLKLSFSFQLHPRGVEFGSDDPVMLFHEWGTAKMPPRPVVGPVLIHNGQQAADLIANYEMGAATGRRGPYRGVQPATGRGG